MDSGLTSGQVIELTGITPRQLQWWDERGIVVPRRLGRRRLYSPEDLAQIAVICELRSRGFSLRRVRQVMRLLYREFGRRLHEVAGANADIHLLTDGKSIFIKDSPGSIVDVLKNSRQPILAVCLSDAVQRVLAGFQAPKLRASEDHGEPHREGLKTAVPRRVNSRRSGGTRPVAGTRRGRVVG